MNERIKELALQADAIILGSVQSKSAGLLIEKWEQKFAELIIQECVEVMRLVPYDTDREFGDEIIYQDAVKKHFGVEQ
jgi:hypothetical protein